MIRVVYRTGEEELVPPKFLDILLYLHQIQMFERDTGWVIVGVDPLRETETEHRSNNNRRQHKQTPLPSPLKVNSLNPLRPYSHLG